MKERRNIEIDIAKGIGIICVILGHCFYRTTYWHRLIYMFHMPFFFIISGMLFKWDIKADGLVCKILLKRVLPYLFFVSLSFVLMYDVYIQQLLATPLETAFKILKGRGVHSLWFLLALMSVELSAWGVWACKRWIDSNIYIICVVFALIIVSFVISEFVTPSNLREVLPVSILCTPSCLFFFILGMSFGQRLLFLSRRKLLLGLSIICFPLMCFFLESGFHLCWGVFSVKAIPSAIIGSSLLLGISSFVCKVRVLSSCLSKIGRNSLCFFALEQPIAHLFSKCLGWKDPLFAYPHSFALDLLRFIFVFMILYLIAPFVLRQLTYMSKMLSRVTRFF